MAATPHTGAREPEENLLVEIERVAIEFARLAGADIVTALGGMLSVKYKTGRSDQDSKSVNDRDPVSEVDQRVEAMIRARIQSRFPDHGIIGEEIEEKGDASAHEPAFVWAIDPIDGTMNFINGFPLFAASIGVLHRGRPIAGAVWCATSHALHAGVYHGRAGGPLCFDDVALDSKANPAVLRRLAGEPSLTDELGFPWEVRKTGSAAIECAFVAAGLLRVARFKSPNIWDVAGGLALVKSAGLEVRARSDRGWTALDSFATAPETPGGKPQASLSALRRWRRALVLGEADAVDRMCRAHPVEPIAARSA